MYSKKNSLLLIIVSFLLSIIFSHFFLLKYDRYEISTDSIENHAFIKGDIPDIWIEAENIKQDIESGENYFMSGNEIFRSYLPPRIVAFYSMIANYSLFSDWDKQIINSEKGKFPYLILQAAIFFLSLGFFYLTISKIYPLKNCFFTILFLALCPNIFLFHSSFHTESVFFSLQIFTLSLILLKSKKITINILIGISVGFMFLQKTTMIYYCIPIILYYAFYYKFNFLKPAFFLLVGYFLVIVIVGFANFKRAGIFYVMPGQAKDAVHFYMLDAILAKQEKISTVEAAVISQNDLNNWIEKNNIDINIESDKVKYYNFHQKYAYKTFINNPIATLQYMSYKTLQTGVLSPSYIFDFFKYENEKKPPFYLEKSWKNKWIPINLIYSIIIYTIILIGFFKTNIKSNLDNSIILILSSLYLLAMLGWVGNSRYFCPILIYLSIFFGNGVAAITSKNK
jgi:hypothetical protein